MSNWIFHAMFKKTPFDKARTPQLFFSLLTKINDKKVIDPIHYLSYNLFAERLYML